MPEKLRTTRTLWGALLASTFMYLTVLVVLQQNGTPPAGEVPWLMAPVFATLAIGLAVASVVAPRAMLRAALLAKRWELVELSPEQRMFSERQGRVRYFSDPEGVRGDAFPHQQVTFIIGMALAEAVAILGFLLLYLGFGWAWGGPFFAVCWGLMLARYPSRQRLDRQIEDTCNADLAAPGGGAELSRERV